MWKWQRPSQFVEPVPLRKKPVAAYISEAELELRGTCNMLLGSELTARLLATPPVMTRTKFEELQVRLDQLVSAVGTAQDVKDMLNPLILKAGNLSTWQSLTTMVTERR